ncbi:MAG: DUF7003 family protein [Acidimicrobiales bacterium]
MPPELQELLVVDDWHHPDVVNEELPSQAEAFRRLALVAVSADASRYHPTGAQDRLAQLARRRLL